MSPDSTVAVVIALALAVVAAVVTALGWDRLKAWRAWTIRPLAVVLCLATAAGAGGVVANRQLGFYGSWRELAGLGAAEPGNDSVEAVSAASSGSRVVSFLVRGPASHLTMRAYAYLPPGYDDTLRHQRLPVVMVLDGFPGSPHVWLSSLNAPQILDHEIAAGRMAPTVVVFPYQSPVSKHDTECVDAVGGLAVDTFLTVDVRSAVIDRFRVRADGAAWGLMGYSTGGFCAVNLALRHPQQFAAAASLSGDMRALTDATTGDLYRGNAAIRQLNDPLWRIAHLPPPPIALYLVAGAADRPALDEIGAFAALAKPPLRLTTGVLGHVGHTMAAFRAMEAPSFDWLSSWLVGPDPAVTPTA